MDVAGHGGLWIDDYGGRINWKGRAIQLRGERATIVQAKITELDSLADLISQRQTDLQNNEEQLKKAGPFAKKSILKRINEAKKAIAVLKKQKATAIAQVEQSLSSYATTDDTPR
jgi:hypothetical protein